MATKPTTKNKGGRPVGGNKPLDWEVVDKLASFFCTEFEIADIVGFSRVGLINRCKKDKNCSIGEYIAEHQSKGKVSLRRQQFKLAMSDGKGATTMLIWLGKNILGQSDKQEMIHSGHISTNPADFTDEELVAIIERRRSGGAAKAKTS